MKIRIILTLILLISCPKSVQKKNVNFVEFTSEINSILMKDKFNGVVLLTKGSVTIFQTHWLF